MKIFNKTKPESVEEETSSPSISKLKNVFNDTVFTAGKVTITNLYPYSKVSLKRKRLRKKFNKYYHRYVSDTIRTQYWGALIMQTVSRPLGFHSLRSVLNIEPISEPMPSANMHYIDYQYNKN